MIDAAFGNWLAGFTDGEGCFVLSRVGSRNRNPNLKTWPVARYEINLRGDDLPALEMIRERLGFGKIYRHNTPKNRPTENPSYRFTVFGKEPCLAIIALFDTYPLRAKKAAQFAVWKQGVLEIYKGRDRDDDLIDHYRTQLATLRVYQELAAS